MSWIVAGALFLLGTWLAAASLQMLNVYLRTRLHDDVRREQTVQQILHEQRRATEREAARRGCLEHLEARCRSIEDRVVAMKDDVNRGARSELGEIWTCATSWERERMIAGVEAELAEQRAALSQVLRGPER